MCTNKKWIYNKYAGKKILVNCGNCPACRQEKANKLADRIRNNHKSGFVDLFCHLTYSNECIPYFYSTDLSSYDDNPKFTQELKIYRGSHNRRIRLKDEKLRKYVVVKDRKIGEICIDKLQDIEVPSREVADKLPKLTNGDDFNKVGVLYFKDYQDFIKRLKQYVKYHYNIAVDSNNFKVFCCGEYGEALQRPHFHILAQVKSNDIAKWKDAICANWLFDDYDNTKKHIEIARDAASYASSYINCDSYLSPFFRQKQLYIKRTHSLDYGFNNPAFSFSEILSAIRRRDLRYTSIRNGHDGKTNEVTIPYPQYVSNRFFPSFKGFSRINDDEIRLLLEYPENLLGNRELQIRLGYIHFSDILGDWINDSERMFKKIVHTIYRFTCYNNNEYITYDDFLKDFYDYSLIYAYKYTDFLMAKRSTMWKKFYEDVENEPFQSYDNLIEFKNNPRLSLSLLDYMVNNTHVNIISIDEGIQFFMSNLETDVNKFYCNIVRTANLTNLFNARNKQHRISSNKQKVDYINRIQFKINSKSYARNSKKSICPSVPF